VPRLEEKQELVDALAELSESDVNRGLVLDGARLAGFLSITDLIRALEVSPRGRLAAQTDARRSRAS
jgi:CBS domain-containing protein